MSKSATEILNEHGISLRSYRHGNQKVLCPRCSHTRKNKREPCLSVEVGEEGIRYFCHNCDFHGGEFYDGKDTRTGGNYSPGKPRDRRGDGRQVRRLYGG